MIDVNEEDAFHFIVRCLRERRTGQASNYGYELYLPNVMREYVKVVLGLEGHEASNELSSVSPSFYAASWRLCRMGILRPGIAAYGGQVTEDGSGGNGYSITPMGQDWIQNADQDNYVPTEPGRFSNMLDKLAPQFGEGFRERSQEAIRCYNALAYLACCVMCGAAAESIMLSAAITKDGDREKILKMYLAASGVSKIENFIIGQKSSQIQNEFRGYSALLKYWRNNAAHGERVGISSDEAYLSLNQLARFAIFAEERWNELIT